MLVEMEKVISVNPEQSLSQSDSQSVSQSVSKVGEELLGQKKIKEMRN